MNQIKNLRDLVDSLNEAVTLQKSGNIKGARENYHDILLHEKDLERKILKNKETTGDRRALVNTLLSQTHNNVGVLLEEEGLTGQAVESLRRALKYAPGNVDALTNLARVFIKRSNFDGALQAARKAVDINPQFIPAIIQYSRVCYKLGLPGEALTVLETAGRKPVSNARFFIEYGRTLETLNQLEEAKEKFLKALGVDAENVYALLNLGGVNFKLGRFEEALANYRKILELDPKYYLALTGLGHLFQAMGQYGEAEKSYQMALAIAPNHQETVGFYAMLLETRGEYKGGLEMAEKLLATPRLPERALITGSLTKAECERKLGALEVAIETLKTLKNSVKTPLGRQKANSRLGFAFDQLGKPGEAFDYFKKANKEFLETNQSFLGRREEIFDLIETLMQVDFKPLFPKPKKAKSKGTTGPVFVVGPFMGGASALAQLLQYCPKTAVYLDTHGIQGIRKKLTKETAGYPGCLEGLSEGEISHLTGLFDEINKKSVFRGEKGVDVHVDALNIVDLPLILKMFPEAKLVFVNCHPLDSVLTTFMGDFFPTGVTINFADLKNIADLYVKTLDLWAKFKAELPLDVLEVKYEDLIKTPSPELMKILKFMGHPEAAKGRKKFETEKFFQKAAVLVNENPPYRWEKYREPLGEIIAPLKPYIEDQGYSI